ncbi:hypothetical protein [Photobacterium damselae]|uniref:hypothetical protein n=1 Tax=Photobacterium damselae TaxID=38293 RepID=UPI00109BAB23|nr:hypothetical protein [Photobacterium damselae]
MCQLFLLMRFSNRAHSGKDDQGKGNDRKKAPSEMTGLRWILTTTKKSVSMMMNDQEHHQEVTT